MAKFYSGIDTSVGIGTETLDSMLANGSTYGIAPSQDIDCVNINSTGIHTVGSQIKFSESGSLLIKESDETDYNWTKGIQVGYDGTGSPSPILMFAYNNNGYIADRGGEVRITSDSSPIRIRTLNYGNDPETGVDMATFTPTQSVDLFFNGTKRFETSNTGVTVTGTVAATAYTGDGIVPSGAIIMWSGAANAIPTGYVLCDGNNSTPDLRNKFVVGASNSSGDTTYPDVSPGATGGEATKLLGTANLPSHTHTYTKATHPSGSGPEQNQSGGPEDRTNFDDTGTTGDQGGTMGQAFSILPPYYALCYIMKS